MTCGIHKDELAFQASKGEGRGGEGGKLREGVVGRGKDGRRRPFPYPFRAFLSYFALNFPIDFDIILKTF